MRRYDEDYEPSLTDYGEEIETPYYVVENCLDSLEKEVKPLLRKISRFFKSMGWGVEINHYESGFDNGYADDRLSTVYEIDLVVKGGQKLVLNRKQWVSDGTYKPSFIISFNSAESDDIEEGEPTEVQRDVDEFDQIPTYYPVPQTDFEYFEFIDGDVSRKLLGGNFDDREVADVMTIWVMWYLSEGSRSRSSWKKKRAMIERVASRYLGK